MPLLGQINWERFYGGNGEDAGFALNRASDGFIIAGHTNSSGNGGFDFFLVRIDENGDTLWTRTAGGSDDDFSRCVISTEDGGFLVSGLTYSFGAGNSDVFVVKYNSSGDTLWTRTFGGSIADEIYSIIEHNGSYVLAGRTYSFGAGNFDVYVIALNSDGDSLWTRTYGGTITDGANSIINAEDGFLIVGYTYSFGHGNYDVYVIRIDSSGSVLWQRTYGGSDDDVGTSAVACDDGGFIIGGYTYSFTHGADDIYLIKIDSLGNLIWQRNFGGSGIDEIHALKRVGNLIFGAGVTESYGSGRRDAYVIAINGNGDMVWDETFGYSGNDGAYDIALARNGNLVITGYSNRYGSYDVYSVNFNPGVGIQESRQEIEQAFLLNRNLKLTVKERKFVKIYLFSSSGRLISKIFSGQLSPGIHNFTLPTKMSGVFFVKIDSGRETKIYKGVYVK